MRINKTKGGIGMYAKNFEYDGQLLSDYNCIVCDFDGSSGAVFASAGSSITFNKISRNHGKSYSLSGIQYDECITATFDICKNPDVVYDGDIYFTSNECRRMMRWLNRNQFNKFRVIYNNGEVENFYFNASFNVEKIKVGERVAGLRLTMETDSPYAYGKEEKYSFSVTNDTLTNKYRVSDMSDDVGDRYVYMEIICRSYGDLKIKNETLNTETVIRDCSTNEEIILDGDTLTLKSSFTRNIFDSFNFEFPQITNSMDNRVNIFSFSLPCTVLISYKPVIKETF